MSSVRMWLCLLGMLVCASALAGEAPPRSESFEGAEGQRLRADIFEPQQDAVSPRAAIVLLHGGGWSEGEAAWIHPTARLLAGRGMVAIAIEYRLSNQRDVTPFDAVSDARSAVRWVRRNAARLGVDPGRIAAGGISAGGHLAAASAVFDEPGGGEVPARPDLLVLWSPALAVATDAWFGKLSGGRAQAASLSPDRHVRAGLPPTVVLQGAEDSVTPAIGAERFCTRMRAVGNICELTVYPGVGHLFTRNLQQQEMPDYKAIDLKIDADADEKAIVFLRQHGFIAAGDAP